MAPILSIKNLSVQFKHGDKLSSAVHNSSFEVAAGELVAIVGESGSGKSVTALSVLQLLPDEALIKGEILWQLDKPVNMVTLSKKTLRQIRGNEIAMIFQEPMTSLNPLLTCGAQVMEVVRIHQQVNRAVARQKTIELFRGVNLPDPEITIGRFPHELSGGQKQRVMIAMAMCCNPALLIADEPTTALDVTVQKTILELIKTLQLQNQMGVIFITHDLGLVADIADRILVMYKGEIVEQGIAKEVLSTPKHPYTKALLACRPAGYAKNKRLPVITDFIGFTKSGKDSISPKIIPVAKNSFLPAPVLIVENLSVRFPIKRMLPGIKRKYVTAVDDVSFKVGRGEIVGLVGESGCGKTSLGKSILQLIKPSTGKILLNGTDLSKTKAAELRNIRKDLQIVFQDPYGSLNPRLTIGEAILEPMKVHAMYSNNNQRKEKVISLLEKVNLETDHYNRYPHQFSGGQRQRICIARALAPDPSFLVFDEMLSALDVSVQAQVLNLVNDLKQEFGFTAIFISHDLSVVHYICDRILVMNKGKIVEDGEARQVFNHPKNEYTKQLIQAIPGKTINQLS